VEDRDSLLVFASSCRQINTGRREMSAVSLETLSLQNAKTVTVRITAVTDRTGGGWNT
jgi:hypothetical protein